MSAQPSQVRRAQKRPAAKPALRVVRRSKPQRLTAPDAGRRRVPMFVGGVIVVIALVFGILLEQVVLAQSAFRLTEHRARLQAAEEHHETLQRKAARLESPARIERFARQVLGMVDPVATGVQYIVADIRPPDTAGGVSSSAGGIAVGDGADIGTALGGGTP